MILPPTGALRSILLGQSLHRRAIQQSDVVVVRYVYSSFTATGYQSARHAKDDGVRKTMRELGGAGLKYRFKIGPERVLIKRRPWRGPRRWRAAISEPENARP